MVIFLSLFFLKILGVGGLMMSSRFSYEGDRGPEHWSELFEGCAGKRQSPIALSKSSSLPSNFKPIEFINYDFTYSQSMLLNNGHSAQVFVEQPGRLTPKIRGGGLRGDYRLMQYHFHWGEESDRGSEHTINGKRYPMEMHLVHYSAKYKDIHEAMNKSDGIAVIALLFKRSMYDNPDMEPLIESLSRVIENGDQAYLRRPMNVLDIVPKDTASFFRYSGSLTTPDCNEVVIWTVFKSFASISEGQLEEFRALEGFRVEGEDEVEHIGDNFRPLQKLNNRLVLLNKDFSLKKSCRYPHFCIFQDNKLKSAKIHKYFGTRGPTYLWI